VTDPPAEIIDGLYELPPEQFIAARDEAVKRARAAGDRHLAIEIGKLRRPTVGAWAVNRLARHRPDLLDELFQIGDEMRAAQRGLHGDLMRELSVRRRSVVDSLVKAAVMLARREYRRDNLPVAEIEATFTAALADPEVAGRVRVGQLTKTVEYTGFGETPRPRLRLVQGGVEAPRPDDRRRPDKDSRQTDEARRADKDSRQADKDSRQADKDSRQADEARRAEEERRADEARRAEEERRAEKERRDAERAAAAQLRRASAAAHRELLAARTELSEAEAARTQAERAVTAARRRVEKAMAALAALGTGEKSVDPG
jgi:hypothetical protein